jgi:hypothetical protein
MVPFPPKATHRYHPDGAKANRAELLAFDCCGSAALTVALVCPTINFEQLWFASTNSFVVGSDYDNCVIEPPVPYCSLSDHLGAQTML